MRFHTVFSETPRKGMFLDKVLNNELEYVTTHHRDFIHLDDVCDAIKILINKNGKIEETYTSFTNPMSKKIITKIESLL